MMTMRLMSRLINPITLSTNAITKLKTVDGLLRIDISSGGCHGFSYEFKLEKNATKNDEIIQQDTVKVIVDKLAIDLIKNSVLDYRTTPMGSAFTLENPNAESSCGCGHSFSIKDE